jgi:hypothetical protein
MSVKFKLANISLFALTISFIILLGGGNYEAINVVGKLASAPPRSLAMLQGPYRFFPVPFWATFHTLTEILFVIALILNWKVSKERRKILLYCFAGAMLIRAVTMLYFAPETGVIAGATYSDTVDPQLLERAQLWKNLNIIRLVSHYAIAIMLIIAVNKNLQSPPVILAE